MWASEMAKSMIKMQKYKQLMSWLTLLPVMVMLPIFLLVQGLMIFCIARIRRLVPLCGPQDREVPAKAEIELYYFHDSPCCAKVRLALEEVGLGGKVRLVHVDIGRYGKYDHLKDAHLLRNPTGTVPVLVHRGTPVLDASTIVRYVEECLDGDASLVPCGAEEKRRMEAIVDECDIDLRPKSLSKFEHCWGNAIGLFGLQSVSYSHKHYGFSKNFYALMKHPNPMIPLNRILFNLFYLRIEPSVTEPAVQKVAAALAGYDALLADGRAFLCGDAFTLADAACVPLLQRMDSLAILDHFVDDETKLEHVKAYYARAKARPSFARVFDDWEPKTKIQKEVTAALKKRRKFVNAVGVYDAFVPEE